MSAASALGRDASVLSPLAQALGADDDQERKGRLLLLGKGAVLAHRFARPLAAELDDKQ